MTSNTSSRKSNGVLPVTGSQAANDAPKASKAKVPAQGKKVIIRRLPPGMTSEEFEAILGEEWKSGNGKVDWTRFHEGEISHDPSNPSLPARCYLHLMRIEDIPILADAVQRPAWEDAKHTANDPALVGPPYLENAPYQKIPTTKRRTDPRQGTIDQDPEFMAFLSSLTQDPVPKEADSEPPVDDANKADVKVTTTPLIEYLKEKKANKGKETANAKSGKHSRHESQGGKTKEDSKKKGKESKAEKAEKAAEKEREKEKDKEKVKEPVKLLTKKAAAQEAAEAAKSVANQISTSKQTEEPAPKSRRANIAAAAKILQRDLGLSPGSAHRRARQDAAKAEAAAKADAGKEKETKDPVPSASSSPSQPTSSMPPSTPTAPKAQATESSRRSRGSKASKQNASGDNAKGKGTDTTSTNNTKSAPTTTPVILKRKDEATSIASTSPNATTTEKTPSSAPAPPTGPKTATSKATSSGKGSSSTQKKGSSQPSVTAGAMRAFVKHANPSQGVTEPLLKQAMEVFGPVTFVEIDKRKGFAYVDFGDHDALVKAITASPISVAQGTVQVLERKDAKKAATAATPSQPATDKTNETQPDRPKRGGRGRGRRGGGGNAASGSAGAGEATGPSTPAAETKNATSTG
ncbi:Smg-4/UPF3 family-domain-containing protein [Biscogniauxia mediterranea]|nr:Smg-4/UPF3 family-domain-containing protein [Biscogniauxia mediterranea]